MIWCDELEILTIIIFTNEKINDICMVMLCPCNGMDTVFSVLTCGWLCSFFRNVSL